MARIQTERRENFFCLKFIYTVIFTLKCNAAKWWLETKYADSLPTASQISPRGVIWFLAFSYTAVFLNKHKTFGNWIYFPSSDERVEEAPTQLRLTDAVYPHSRSEVDRLEDVKWSESVNTSNAYSMLISLDFKILNVYKKMQLERALWRFTQQTSYALFDLSKEFTISSYFPLRFTWQMFSPYLSDKFGFYQDFNLSVISPYLTKNIMWIIRTDNNSRHVKWL